MQRVDVFFYGLFMDATLLRAKGIDPGELRRASLKGFELRIGQRATLMANPATTVHGLLGSLSQEDLDRLYSEPSVREYRPQSIEIQAGDRPVRAQCYITTMSGGLSRCSPG